MNKRQKKKKNNQSIKAAKAIVGGKKPKVPRGKRSSSLKKYYSKYDPLKYTDINKVIDKQINKLKKRFLKYGLSYDYDIREKKRKPSEAELVEYSKILEKRLKDKKYITMKRRVRHENAVEVLSSFGGLDDIVDKVDRGYTELSPARYEQMLQELESVFSINLWDSDQPRSIITYTMKNQANLILTKYFR